MKFSISLRRVGFVTVILGLSTLAGCGKPDLKRECSLSSDGEVACLFTNKGSAKGHLCLQPVVDRSSNLFFGDGEICSGVVEANDVREVRRAFSFNGRNIHEICGGSLDLCKFRVYTAEEMLTTKHRYAPSTSAEVNSKDMSERQDGDEGGATLYSRYLMARGESVYRKHCIQCHQSDGGKYGSIKGLDRSAVVLDVDKTSSISIVLNGSGSMPPLKDKLTDLDVAAVTTFIKNAWSNETDQIVHPNEVTKFRK